MFEIDLQRGARHADGTENMLVESATTFAPVAIAAVLLIATLWGAGSWLDGRIATERQEVERLEKVVASSRQQLAEISGRRRALLALEDEEIYWSDQLRLLSRNLPDKLWLSRIAVVTTPGGDKQPPTRRLRVEGGFLSASSEGNLDLIGRFVETLQQDKRFRDSFTDLKLESVKRATGDANALTFELSARFGS